MRIQDLVRLFSLAAIWGGSFVFLRILAPVLGPIVMAGTRLFIAGGLLLIYFYIVKTEMHWKLNFRHYLVIGIINSALPFALFSFASLHIPASYGVLLNSTSPLFGAVFSALWLGEKFNLKKLGGLLLGCVGVAFIAGGGFIAINNFWVALSVAACLVGSTCYALSGIYIKKFAHNTKAMGFAGASQFLAGLVLLPFIPLSPLRGEITSYIALNFLALTLVCSMIAYLLYYRLLADIGPTKALTVTFLMPVFGMLWAALFLKEPITFLMVIGATLILTGTSFVVKTR